MVYRHFSVAFRAFSSEKIILNASYWRHFLLNPCSLFYKIEAYVFGWRFCGICKMDIAGIDISPVHIQVGTFPAFQKQSP
jgi:hypothetical protein